MNLCVIVLTTDLNAVHKPPKFIPKVCYKVGEKTMIEICLENIALLNPSRIILMVSKYDIFYINKLIKHASYSKLISYCIFDNQNNERPYTISLAKNCYSGKNILVVPGNSPLLTSKIMYRMISENRNVKITNHLFYLEKECVSEIDYISDYNTGDEDFITAKEKIQIESVSQYEEIKLLFEKKSKYKFLHKRDT